MSINLSKGGSVNLQKENGETLVHIDVGVGWDPVGSAPAPSTTEAPAKKGFLGKILGAAKHAEQALEHAAAAHKPEIDLDTTVFLLDAAGKIKNTVYFGNRRDDRNGILHHGDDLTGRSAASGQDNEVISFDLSKVQPEIAGLDVWANIFACQSRHQTMGDVSNAFIRIVNKDNSEEMCKFNMSGEQYKNDTAVHLGSIKREGSSWKFHAAGEGTKDTSISEIESHVY